ncbi:MAG: bacteriohemerythrin [Pseudomonadales bacterium]|jgi:hemerythrin-like metal-binding protein|nr:bacteriohemerythrin [Pseudomonadales bacterium]MDP7360502.1 bacteriohemerythrin [Pseudomonadales bacterium]MDP7594421.1 bacteriohemerythrin [Pseudomonadales bacterium]HJN50975.1 bacteriohemerythrin [Pseudomonadales bacterium]|tara:strand:- start:421 stop:834 length:414 start_codon:yes stop_codon:yes gene_type:complete
MDKIEWSDKFTVGVEVLDEQHKTLVGMINNLLETPNVASNTAIITELLNAMIQYAITHFETEEGLMRRYTYPAFESQKEQHVEFMKNTSEFCKVEEGTVVIENFSDSVLTYLREWWVNHILVDDMKYKSFFAEKGRS